MLAFGLSSAAVYAGVFSHPPSVLLLPWHCQAGLIVSIIQVKKLQLRHGNSRDGITQSGQGISRI